MKPLQFLSDVEVGGAKFSILRDYSPDSTSAFGYRLGEGSLKLAGRDRTTGEFLGGFFLTYEGNPHLPADRGAAVLYPMEPNTPASLSIAPSGLPENLPGDATASIALQYRNGYDNESRMVMTVNKRLNQDGEIHPEGIIATLSTGVNSETIPIKFYIKDWKLLELTDEGQVNLFFKGYPVMKMNADTGIVTWYTAQQPVIMNSAEEVKAHSLLGQAEAGTEVNFIDRDGLIKKAIKQNDGIWRRVNDLSAL